MYVFKVKSYTECHKDKKGIKKAVKLRRVKAQVQNLMKNGIQNLICMHFNLLFCKNHHEILTVNVNQHFFFIRVMVENFSNFSLRMGKFTKT